MANKCLLSLCALLLLFTAGCESPYDPELPFDSEPFEPSFQVLTVQDATLFGVTNQGELVRITVSGGVGTARLIGDAGTQAAPEPFQIGWTGITYGPDGELYATSRTSPDTRYEELCGGWACTHLYRIDRPYGRDLSVVDLGSLGVPNVVDIAWGGDPWMGATYLVLDEFFGEIGGGHLRVTVDGVATAYGDYGPLPLTGGWPPGPGGIAFYGGTWYGIDIYSPPTLFEIDQDVNIGKAKPASARYLVTDPSNPVGIPVTGLTVTAGGQAFATTRGAFELYAVDLTSGVIEQIPLSVDGASIAGRLTSITEAVQSSYTFAAIDVTTAEVSFAPEGDSFTLEGALTLAEDSDGLFPLDAVLFEVGFFSEVIPGSAFVEDGNTFRYTGTAPGVTLMELRDDFTFTIQGDGISMPPADLAPQPVSLQVGNDEGSWSIPFELVGAPPPRPTSTLLASTEGGEILSLDLAAGTGSIIGGADFERDVGWTGLAFAPNGNLFVSSTNASGINNVDECEGEVEIIGTQCSHLFIVEADSGHVYRDLGSTDIAVVSDLTFESETLYGSYFANVAALQDGGLATFDRPTGAATSEGRHGAPAGGEAPYTNGGIAYDSERDVLWAIEDQWGGGRLLELDRDGTVLSSVPLRRGTRDFTAGFAGLESLPGGFLVGVGDGNSSDLYQIDPETGQVRIIPMSVPGLLGKITSIVEFTDAINRPPKANAGPDQTHLRTSAADVEVTLDGSLSFDPDDDALMYTWTEGGTVLGTTETLEVSLGVGVHVITLSVLDVPVGGPGAVRESDVTITILNNAPVADAGPDLTVSAGADVQLDGSGSSDVDGTIDLFEWIIDGQVEATGPTPTLTLPLGTYSVTLRVTDNDLATDEDVVTVTVAENSAPVADAGPDQTVECTAAGEPCATLDGSASTDADGDVLTYTWTQGGTVLGSSTDPTLAVDLPVGTYAITLTVDDGRGLQDTDEVVIDVVDTTPPEITASLEPVDGKSLKSKKGEFTVQFSCSDACDESAGASATINGVEVENGQVVDLRLKSSRSERSQKSEKSKKSGKSDKPDRIEGPAEDLVLVVVCTDAAGNTSEVTVTPEFAEKSAKSAKSKKSGKRRS